MIIRVITDEISVMLYFCNPSVGWGREGLRRCNVILTSRGIRISHSMEGNLGLQVARPEQKWFFHVGTACLEEFFWRRL